MKEYTLGVQFTVDDGALNRIAGGATVNLEKFTAPEYTVDGKKVIPAGTVVIRDTDNRVIPAAGTEPAGTAFIMASDVVEGTVQRNSPLTTGLYAGGVFFEDKLPQAQSGVLAAGLKTALGPKFTFQKSAGSLIVKQ